MSLWKFYDFDSFILKMKRNNLDLEKSKNEIQNGQKGKKFQLKLAQVPW